MYVDCGTLVDGTGTVIEDARLRVDEGRIAAVGPREDVDAAGERVDHGGETVVPGLIDAHVHLQGMRSMDPTDWVTTGDALGAARATADLRRLLDAGFTTVRDCGSTTGIGLREAVAAGEIPGPRVFTSGPAISQTGGHGDAHRFPREWVADRGLGIATLADGPVECRRTARTRAREGADLLKIMTTGGVLSERDAPDEAQFTDAEVAAMVEEAHCVGMPVASHAQGAAGVVRALENGVDTIEHGFYLDEASLSLFVETGAVLVPTLSVIERVVTAGEAHGVPPHAVETSREARDAHRESVRRAHEAGVPIATGSDFMGPEPVAHGGNALELELLVEAVGFTSHEALQAATRVRGPDPPGRRRRHARSRVAGGLRGPVRRPARRRRQRRVGRGHLRRWGAPGRHPGEPLGRWAPTTAHGPGSPAGTRAGPRPPDAGVVAGLRRLGVLTGRAGAHSSASMSAPLGSSGRSSMQS